MNAGAYHSGGWKLGRAACTFVAISQTTDAPEAMKGIVVDVHGVRSRAIV